MKVYIAAKLENRQEVERIIKLIRDKNHEIIIDWTKDEPINKPYENNIQVAKERTIRDVSGIKNSDAFILLTDEGTNKGMYIELGVAIDSNIRTGKPKIYVTDKNIHNSIFYYHPSIKIIKNIQEILQIL
jgi:hypothetical protein